MEGELEESLPSDLSKDIQSKERTERKWPLWVKIQHEERFPICSHNLVVTDFHGIIKFE